MRKLHRNILIGCFLLIIIALGVIGIFIIKPKQDAIKTISSYQYNATLSIEKAKDILKKEGKEANIITDVNTTEKVMSLTFKGLSDSKTNQRILDLLSDYDMKATFFLPGILAAEDTKTVKNMYQDGHQLENNTLTEAVHLEEFSENRMLDEICRTNDIIETIIGVKPNVLLGNSTTYTSDVRKASYASGNDMLLESNHYISYQSFTSYKQVLDYVKGLDKGSILTIKLNGVLSEDEYGNKELNENLESDINEETPAIDQQPSIENENNDIIIGTEEERLIQIVEWILQALQETKYNSVFVEDITSYNDVDFVKDFEDLKLSNKGNLAEVVTRVNTGENLVSFTFRGIGNQEKLKDLLTFLDNNHIKATFFITGDEVIDYPEEVKLILTHGQQVGNGGLTGKDLTDMDFSEVCFEIYKSDKLFREKLGIKPEVFMPVYGKYNDTIREAVSALDYQLVTYNKNPITDVSRSVAEIMDYFKNGIKKGDIIYFRLDYYNELLSVLEHTMGLILDNNYKLCSIRALIANQMIELANYENKSTTNESNYQNANTDKRDHNYNQTKNSNPNSNTNGATTQNSNDNSIDMDKEELRKILITNLREENAGALAKEISTIYTTEQALSYTFTGISQIKVLEDVLKTLDELNAKGTFFVTEQEVENNGDLIKQIALAGHEIQICLNTSTTKDFFTTSNSILNIREKVEELTGQKPTLVRYSYVIHMEDEILEAISSTGCEVVWQDVAFASSKVGKEGTFEQVLDYAYNNGNITTRRGYIVFYRMDFYDDPSLIGNLMKDFALNRVDTVSYQDEISNNGSNYEIKTLGQLLSSSQVYQYPVEVENILPTVKNSIFSGHLNEMAQDVKFTYLKERYIGTPEISTSTTLPGFTDDEVLELNKSGTFTNDKVLFLTFDDWGSDKPINQILYVLNKYNVKASFFVRTHYIETNPNLVRTIAVSGHDVGSHTDTHLPFANTDSVQSEDDVSAIYTSISEEEADIRKEDLLTSFNKLQSMIGDVAIDGRPAFSKIFRPPTLAMSKLGMETILDMGFTHIVSGDFSTHDYEANNSEELANTILNGIHRKDGTIKNLQNGSILVFHMSDDSNIPNKKNDITAEALDIVIPKLIEEGYEFARLSQYLSDDN